MEQEVRQVLSETGRLGKPVSDIRVDDDLYDAGLTSLSTVNVMLGLEDKFDVEFSDELLVRSTFKSISSLISIITSLK